MKKIISLALVAFVFAGTQIIAAPNEEKGDKETIVAQENIDTNQKNKQKLEELRSNIKAIEEKLKTAEGDEKTKLANELMLSKEQEQKLQTALKVGIVATILGVFALPKNVVVGTLSIIRNNPIKSVVATAALVGAAAAAYYYFSPEEVVAKPAPRKK